MCNPGKLLVCMLHLFNQHQGSHIKCSLTSFVIFRYFHREVTFVDFNGQLHSVNLEELRIQSFQFTQVDALFCQITQIEGALGKYLETSLVLNLCYLIKSEFSPATIMSVDFLWKERERERVCVG